MRRSYRRLNNREFAKDMAAGLSLPVATYIYGKTSGYGNRSNKQALNKSIRRAAGKPQKYKYSRRRFYKSTSANVAKLKKDVSKLKKEVKVTMSTYIKKYRNFPTALSAATTQCAYSESTLNSLSVLQDVIDNVKYFNPSVPGTLINVDLTAPTFSNKVLFKRSYVRAIARCNYSVPARVSMYVLSAKKDTSTVPTTTFSDSLTDTSNASSTSPLIKPSDCIYFRDLYKIDKHVKKLIYPGQELEISHSYPSFYYDISLADTQTDAYQPRFHGSLLLVRVEGVQGHGSTSGVAQSRAGVDIEFIRIHEVQYPGGADLLYIEVDDNPGAISGTLQLSLQDVAQETYGL